MKGHIRRAIGVICIVMALVVTQIPALKVSATDPSYQVDGEILVKYTGSGDTIEIPASVRIIGEDAFADNDNIKSIVLGDGIREIRYHAFFDCDNLESVQIGEGCKLIGNAAFADCDILSSVYIGKSVEDFGSGVFAGDENLRTLDLSPENVSLQYANGCIYNGNAKVFYEMLPGAEVSYYSMPDSVEDISKYAFWGCNNLRYVQLSSKLKELPAYSFSNCRSLEAMTVPYSVTRIGAKAFENCSSLRGLELPPSISDIHKTAFDGCNVLKISTDEFGTPYNYIRSNQIDSLTKVEYEELLSNLQEALGEEETMADDEMVYYPGEELSPTPTPVISTPADITISQNPSEEGHTGIYIEDGIQVTEQPTVRRDDITPIIVEDYETTVSSGYAMFFVDNRDQKVYDGSVDTPLSYEDYLADLARAAAQDEEDGGTAIPDVIGNPSMQKGMYIPKYTVIDNRIADHAYYALDSLDAYDFPSDIVRLGDFSFARTGLTSIAIPDGVETIGMGAFYHCNQLADVSIPSSVKYIGNHAFSNTPYLNNFLRGGEGDSDYLIVGDGILLAYRGNEAKVEIPEGVKSIAAMAFANHNEIVVVSLPSSLVSIEEEAFMNCKGLTSVTGGDRLSEIHDRAFYGCPLKYMKLNNLDKLGVQAIVNDGTTQGDSSVCVEFKGAIPTCSYDEESTMYYNADKRGLVLSDSEYVIVENADVVLDGTVLDPNQGGFRGIILCWMENEVDITEGDEGEQNNDSSEPVTEKYLSVLKVTQITDDPGAISIPESLTVGNDTYEIKDKLDDFDSYYVNPLWALTDREKDTINLTIDSSLLQNHGLTRISLPGNQETLFVTLNDSDDAADIIQAAYDKQFSNSNVFTLRGFDILAEDANHIPIHSFGSNRLSLTVEAPAEMQKGLLYVYTVDSDGQMEAVDADVYEQDGIRMVKMNLAHLSPYAFCCYTEDYTMSLYGNLDNTPDTGDYTPFIRMSLIVGFLALGLSLLLWGIPLKRMHK